MPAVGNADAGRVVRRGNRVQPGSRARVPIAGRSRLRASRGAGSRRLTAWLPYAEQLLEHGVHRLAEARGIVGEQRRFYLAGAGGGRHHQAGHLLVSFGVIGHRKEDADGFRSLELEDFPSLRPFAASVLHADQNLAHGRRLGRGSGHSSVGDFAPLRGIERGNRGGRGVPALHAEM